MLAWVMNLGFAGGGAPTPPVPVVIAPSGGFFYDLDGYGAKRRRARQEREQAVEDAQSIQDELDRSIALLLHEQEAKDAERTELLRLRKLAADYAPIAHTQIDNERVLKALDAAREAHSLAAFEALSREIERMNDEEDFAVLLMLSAD